VLKLIFDKNFRIEDFWIKNPLKFFSVFFKIETNCFEIVEGKHSKSLSTAERIKEGSLNIFIN
jgi:hypothetical protein